MIDERLKTRDDKCVGRESQPCLHGYDRVQHLGLEQSESPMTRDEGTKCHPEQSEGSSRIYNSQVRSSWRHVVSIGSIALMFALILSACSDYEDLYQDAYGYLLDEAKIDYGYFVDDRDNQSYKTVKIGSQTWMAENLNYEYKVNKKVFGNYENSKHPEYGRYYTWAAAMDSAAVFTADGKGCGYGKSCSPAVETQGVCPDGWHLPTKDEFVSLWRAVGGQSTAGINLKFRKGWENDGDGINRYGFSALPAGGYYKQTFLNVGENAAYWSATLYDNKEAYFMDLHSSSDDANWNNHTKEEAYSVRCLKNVKATSKSSSSVVKSSSSTVKSSSSSAKLSSSVPKSSSSVVKSCSSVAKFSSSEVKLSSSVAKSSSSKKVLSSSSKTVASSAVVKSCSSVVKSSSSVAKSSSSSKAAWAYLNPKISYGEVVDNRDKQVYKTVKIGNQTWMAENLNYKRQYCAQDEDSLKCAIYGSSYRRNDLNSVCPENWHLPSKAEYDTLMAFVGGKTIAGSVLKSRMGWFDNGNGTDSVGFSAIPVDPSDTIRCNLGYGNMVSLWGSRFANFWTSESDASLHPFVLSYNSSMAGYADTDASCDGMMYSVRCIKD